MERLSKLQGLWQADARQKQDDGKEGKRGGRSASRPHDGTCFPDIPAKNKNSL